MSIIEKIEEKIACLLLGRVDYWKIRPESRASSVREYLLQGGQSRFSVKRPEKDVLLTMAITLNYHFKTKGTR